MKKTAIVITALLFAFACSSNNNAGVKLKVEDMCSAMEKYDPSDPATLLETYDAMALIELNKEKYGEVSNETLLEEMVKTCPEGAKKFEQLKPGI